MTIELKNVSLSGLKCLELPSGLIKWTATLNIEGKPVMTVEDDGSSICYLTRPVKGVSYPEMREMWSALNVVAAEALNTEPSTFPMQNLLCCMENGVTAAEAVTIWKTETC
jgi:aminoglycoside phosphotransferase